MRRFNEKGSALLFALILVLVLSVMGASLMFMAQSETWSGANYKLLTQSRYGAEAGLHAAANYLMYTYTAPANTNGFNVGVYPLTDNGGNPVVLSTLSGGSSNYPSSAIVSGFAAATDSHANNKSLAAGYTNVDYTVSAQLLAMAQVTPFGATKPVMIQTWQLTAHGDIKGVRNAETEVSAILERQITPTFAYAAFASNNGCGALSFTGNGGTNSYDSAQLTTNGGSINPGSTGQNIPFDTTFGGNVGTNGNLTDSGNNVSIGGSLSSPRTGVGACSVGNITALTGSTTQVDQGIKELSQVVTYPPPVTDYPGCTGSGAAACDASTANTLNGASLPNPLTPGNYGDISAAGQSSLALNPGVDANGNCVPAVYYINSISLSGQATLTLNPCPGTGGNGGNKPAVYQPVMINIVGSNQSTPLNLSGQGLNNPTFDATLMQFNYSGNGQINIVGNGASAAVVYAPNATASFKGNAHFYGSVIAAQVTDVGNGTISYDRKLQRKLFTVGNYMLDSFTWSKY